MSLENGYKTKAQRAANIKVGTVLKQLPSMRWYLRGKNYKVLEVIHEGEGALPLFKVKDSDGKVDILTHRFFKID